MAPYVVGLGEVDARAVALVGGKGANLGELTRLSGVSVPPGFCVTTEAFRRGLDGEVSDAIVRALAGLGDGPWAVRSSATTEDLPGAASAGLHDSFLDVPGPEVLDAVRRCWPPSPRIGRSRTGVAPGSVHPRWR
jgi:pyruvate,water dikinase